MASAKGPGLYEFLTEAELQDYFNVMKTELKVQNVGQLKFVTDEDLLALGMTRPEIRRLKKFFQKYHPQTYLSKFKKKLLSRRESDGLLHGTEDAESLSDASELRSRTDVDRCSMRVTNRHIISAEAIVINKELGVGEFGVVQQGVWTNENGDRIQVAIKCLSTERLQSQPLEFLKEAAIMHSINSEHIVRLYGVVLDSAALMLVTELAPLRSLLECLKEPSLRSSFPVLSLCSFSVQICDGMAYLEKNRLIHRDLAARNILVFSKNKVKISDFGLSRALRVGKDYYQTNFNVNLKLPIAWCAPECINYLRFTSASDVWAFGVTLWEMFSYGFQPWPALTGHQILEAIDEPNYERLDQPDACPRDYYSVMLQCWQHDPECRPKFHHLLTSLPDCKPEQVQAVREHQDPAPQLSQLPWLNYALGDVITVLDKRPSTEESSQVIWKGVLNNGKTGFFNPSHTVAYLGPNVPSNKLPLVRGDGKNTCSSRRRLRPDMISRPQGDLKHTGHVGLDGTFFGDVGILATKTDVPRVEGVPVHRVPPYKPYHSADADAASALSRAGSDASERAPLLKKSSDEYRAGLSSSVRGREAAAPTPKNLEGLRGLDALSAASLSQYPLESIDHYTEISDEEPEHHRHNDKSDDRLCNSLFYTLPAERDKGRTSLAARKEDGTSRSTFDLGPSLMDEVLRALDDCTSTTSPDDACRATDADVSNVRNEIRELTLGRTSKKKQVTVKPISASDERTLDSAIALAHELASRSMLALNQACEADVWATTPPYSPPSSPTSPHPTTRISKFPFKFSSRSPKHERRHFSEEVASIPDIQASIPEQAKEAYNALVGGSSCHSDTHATNAMPLKRSEAFHQHASKDLNTAAENGLSASGKVLAGRKASCDVTVQQPPDPSASDHHSNPLRLLRAGITVRPKIRGNKHSQVLNLVPSDGPSSPSMPSYQDSTPSSLKSYSDSSVSASQTLPKHFKNSETRRLKDRISEINQALAGDYVPSGGTVSGDASAEGDGNPLPLPPRDRTRASQNFTKPRHHRKHPLIIPGMLGNALFRSFPSNSTSPWADKTEPNTNLGGRLVIQHTHNPQLEDKTAVKPGVLAAAALHSSPRADDDSLDVTQDMLALNRLSQDGCSESNRSSMTDLSNAEDSNSKSSSVPPAKPPRLFSKDCVDGVEVQVAADGKEGLQQAGEMGLFEGGTFSLSPRATSLLDQNPFLFSDRIMREGKRDRTSLGKVYQSGDHVSCEDLLEFALDKPDSRRTSGPQHGESSDECKLILKILKNQVSGQECVSALDVCHWDVHHSLKLLRVLLLLLPAQRPQLNVVRETLVACAWDVAKAASFLSNSHA